MEFRLLRFCFGWKFFFGDSDPKGSQKKGNEKKSFRLLSEIKIRKKEQKVQQKQHEALIPGVRRLPYISSLGISWRNERIDVVASYQLHSREKSPNNEKFLEPGVGDLKIAFYSEAIYLSVFHAFLISINFVNSSECRECRKRPWPRRGSGYHFSMRHTWTLLHVAKNSGADYQRKSELNSGKLTFG